MEAVIYLRVSTRAQGESGLGMESQLDQCERWALDCGAEVRGVFRDEGASGSAGVAARSGLVAALEAVSRDGVLLVSKRDRLGRDPLVCAIIERMVERKGARVVSAAGEGTEGNAPSDVLMRRIVDAFAEYERLIIGARTRAALGRKRARGERTGGDCPFGYGEEGGRLVPAPSEVVVLAKISQLRRKGASIRAIARELNEAGLSARGSRWHPTTVARILRRGE